MLNINGQNIEISRGDTGAFTITFTGADAPEDGCIVEVSLKKTRSSEDTIWEKKLTVASNAIYVTLLPQDTENLSFGQYWWDARIIFRDGSVYTPMLPASFKVLEVIGDGK